MSFSMTAYVQLLNHVREGPITAQDLAAVTGFYIKTVREFLREMHKHKFVHIKAWDTRHGNRIKLPIYAFGPGRDQPRPKPLDRSVITQRYRAARKARATYDPFYAICR